jgi:hypothetical protein
VSGGATKRWRALVLVPLALTAWVYYPITRVFFFADEFMHLARIATAPFLFVLAPFAGHNYHVRNLVFVGLWHLFGLDPAPWYWTVLFTHLVNVWLLFRVVVALTADPILACLGATIWGICPLDVGAVGFYAVYGQVMASTIMLIVLDGLARRSAAAEPLPASVAAGWYVLLLAGTTCFGTGIGVALVFPLVLFLLLPATWVQRNVRRAYKALPAVTLIVYFAVKRLYGLFEPLPFSELFHESLAASGLLAAPPMVMHLLGFAVSGVMLGYYSSGIYPDMLHLVSIAGFALGLGLLAWRGNRRARRAALAMVVLAVGTYAVIGIARVKVYKGLSAAQAAAWLRYHYQGTIPIAVLLCLILDQIAQTVRMSVRVRGLFVAVVLVVAMTGYLRSNFRIDERPATRAYFKRTAQEVARAAAAAPPGTTVYLENGRATPDVVGIFLEIVFPGRAGVFFLQSPKTDVVDGHRIRFIERDPKVLEYWAARPNEPLGKLLVSPRDVPAAR